MQLNTAVKGVLRAVCPPSTFPVLRQVRRKLRLSPMNRVERELRRRNVRLGDLDALEIFAGDGSRHTKDYASLVSTLEAWEIDPAQGPSLKRNLPMADVKITDSYEEIKKTTRKYSLIVVDNPMSTFGGHCEHYDLLPDIFPVATDSAVVILSVIPEITDAVQKRFPYLFNETQLACRKAFYKTDHPERLSHDDMAVGYEHICKENGFDLEWSFSVSRSFLYYFVGRIKKRG